MPVAIAVADVLGSRGLRDPVASRPLPVGWVWARARCSGNDNGNGLGLDRWHTVASASPTAVALSPESG